MTQNREVAIMAKQADPAAKTNAMLGVAALPYPSELDLSELVNLIAGDSPPPWLADFLSSFAGCIALNRFAVFLVPSRAQLKKKLDKIEKATQVLFEALQDVDLLLLLKSSDLGDAAPREHLRRQLFRLAEQTRKEIAALLGPNGKVRAGAGHAFTAQTFSSEVECAVLIAESWRHVNGIYPAPRHAKAQKSADLLWMLSGGERREGADDVLGTWRQHLQHAIALSAPQLLEGYRAEVRRRLKDAAHIHATMTEENTGEIGLI